MLSGLECDSFTFTFTRGTIRGTLYIKSGLLSYDECRELCVRLLFNPVNGFSKDLLLKLNQVDSVSG